MVKHIIIWTLKEEFNEAQKTEIKEGIKTNLESLKGQIPGLVDIKVEINGLTSSTGDCLLDTTFEDAASLSGYSKHPAHVAVANTYVRPYTAIRSCFDFEV